MTEDASEAAPFQRIVAVTAVCEYNVLLSNVLSSPSVCCALDDTEQDMSVSCCSYVSAWHPLLNSISLMVAGCD